MAIQTSSITSLSFRATRVSSSLHTVQAAHVADRRPSDVNGPPTAAVKAARIDDPPRHAADRRSGYPYIPQEQSRQSALAIRCLHTSRSTAVSFMGGQFNRRGVFRSFGSRYDIVPTMFGRAPRRLQRGSSAEAVVLNVSRARRAAIPVLFICTSVMVALPCRPTL
ncbi:hypothetical protein EVAR_52470_1 [Eumeta japonica]|uniref:Uncharacterized protein n=1 Tax=Eumeta variegata TaxID=151549 RepID=A0A4C1YYL5_EUMVA|nr:hypothetical protein EVAR_52470_1 [Eumeta japonica]